MERDIQLDIYRALSMILIIGVCHVFYGLGVGSEPLISLLLFEMPIIFFISGASISVSKTNQSFIGYLFGRFKRVILPYYIYAFFTLIFITLATLAVFIKKGSLESTPYDIFAYRLSDVIDILLCRKIPQYPFNSHLWFIVPYFVLSIIFYYEKLLLDKTRLGGAILGILLYVVSYYVIEESLVIKITGYNIFMVMGYCFYRRCSLQTMLYCSLIFGLITMTLTFAGFDFIPMQTNKFPPNPIFITYNISILCLMGIIFSKIKLKLNKVFTIFNQRGYTIYLYQTYIFFFVLLFIRPKLIQIDSQIILFILYSFFVLVASYFLSFITYPIERKILSFIR